VKRQATVRWIWIDKFVEFESGRRAVAVKNVSLAEEHLHDHFPGFPIVPASLMIEGMAQTGGILVGEARDFQEKVILAKINRALFHDIVCAGAQLRMTAEVENLAPEAATINGIIESGDQRVAEISMMYSHIDQNMAGLEFPEENFVFNRQFMDLLQFYKPVEASKR
jgi:3-hydroxyacyl-[acyl-carrier-protein] dehydratase